MGLKKPVWERHVVWLKSASGGDFGESAQYRMPTAKLVLERLPATIELAMCALAFAIVFGVVMGLLIFAAYGTIFASTGMAFGTRSRVCSGSSVSEKNSGCASAIRDKASSISRR
jgi:ABC-type dipeptide/oligopeptide/nickel transport system permease component